MRARGLRLVEHRFDVRTRTAAAFRSPRGEYAEHTGQGGGTVSPGSRTATTKPGARKPPGFLFLAVPAGAAEHRKVLLFNNLDAEDRAAVKQWREEGCCLPVASHRRPGKVFLHGSGARGAAHGTLNPGGLGSSPSGSTNQRPRGSSDSDATLSRWKDGFDSRTRRHREFATCRQCQPIAAESSR